MAHLYAMYNDDDNYRPVSTYLSIEDLTDDAVFQMARFPRHDVVALCDMLRLDLERKTARSRPIPVDTQVLAALGFYASGSFQWVLGRGIGLSQTSMSRVIRDVTTSLCRHADEVIQFPTSQQDVIANKHAFHAITGFPNVIGAVDGTHIPIKSPITHEEAYVNRKGIHTINIQAVCDSKLQLLDVVAKWPGSTHDAFMWRSCSLRRLMELGYIHGGWLLGTFYPML